MKPRALILLAQGTNRDHDVAEALSLAGADPEIVPLNHLREKRGSIQGYQMLVLPGGFSYADALGAGKLFAIDLEAYFKEEVANFVALGKPVIGICNGFQALVKAGILPGAAEPNAAAPQATLTFNACGHFECRWVTLEPVSETCIWTKGMAGLVTCPVAHAEGNFQVPDEAVLATLQSRGQIALRYVRPDGTPADGAYPANPNGSAEDIAGICNPLGNVLGLMPHPENHIHPWQHPQWTRGVSGRSGLVLFENGVQYAAYL